MATLRDDAGSTRWIFEGVCKQIGHEEAARVIGKAVSTVRAYCDPGNPRGVPIEAQHRLAAHMFTTHGQAVHFPDLCPDGENCTPKRKASATKRWAQRAA